MMQALRLSLKTASAPIMLQEALNVETAAPPPIAAETFTFIHLHLRRARRRVKRPRRVDPHACAGHVQQLRRAGVGELGEPHLSRRDWRFDCIPRDASKNVGGVRLGLAIGQEAHAFFNKPPSLVGSV
jgi:hypothetical protein